MGFTNQERINLTTKALQAGVIDANPDTVWYEVFFPFAFITDAEQVWTQMSELKALPASNLAQAKANAANNPTLIQDLTTGLRLTGVVGTNSTTYAAYAVYGDTTSEQITNWVLPQLIPQTSGAPSNGYGVKLYDGDPNNGGTVITTTEGETGSGETRTVGWVFNYANGLLFLSEDFKGTVTDPYVQGFRYVGRTAADAGSDIDNSKFVVLEENPELPNAKVLSGGDNVSITETGAEVLVDLTDTGVVPGTYDYATITVDEKGRITAAASNQVKGIRVSFVKPT
jgi:hypothetical protein